MPAKLSNSSSAVVVYPAFYYWNFTHATYSIYANIDIDIVGSVLLCFKL